MMLNAGLIRYAYGAGRKTSCLWPVSDIDRGNDVRRAIKVEGFGSIEPLDRMAMCRTITVLGLAE